MCWAPFLLLWRAGAGRWWPMRRGSGENLSQGLPSPISSSVSTPVGEGSCWLLNCLSPLSGMS
uniref:Predicted gene, 19426 n=1 Tax=Cricetulus griseus TaxID=10029 RepID=A0A8C2N3J4_CRIGR